MCIKLKLPDDKNQNCIKLFIEFKDKNPDIDICGDISNIVGPIKTETAIPLLDHFKKMTWKHQLMSYCHMAVSFNEGGNPVKVAELFDQLRIRSEMAIFTPTNYTDLQKLVKSA